MPALAALCAFFLVDAASARAESCQYDSGTKAVTAEITSGATATLKVVGVELWFGLSPARCGAATTSNTDTIAIAGAPGSVERLVLDQRGGLFAPGATPEGGGISEIEIATALGGADDTVLVYLTQGDDRVAPGQNGMGLNADGDADVTFSPGAFPLAIRALGGVDYVNGRGEFGAGLAFLGTLTIAGGPGNDELLRGSFADDRLSGGAGDDVIEGNDGADVVDGGAGADILRAGGGDDDLTGGPGADVFIGVDGDDVFRAADGEADLQMNGGPGLDTVYYDPDLDPAPDFVETLLPELTPPVVVCDSADGAWHRRNVAVRCTADDPESGVAGADDAFTLTTTVPPGVERANAATGMREVCNGAGLCAQAGPVGGNKVDRRAPANPTRVRSTDHAKGVPSTDRRITVAFNAGTDGGSGVDGFSYSWTKRATSAPDRVKDREQGARRTTSRTLGKGSWFFHLRTRDNAGNWSAPVHLGPFPLR